MQLYSTVIPATFLERPNRFVARVRLGEGEEIVHVKNTGRCRELLRPGARVYLAEGSGEKRRTRYDLVAVEKQRPGQPPLLVNMDSQAPNQVAGEWLKQGGSPGRGAPPDSFGSFRARRGHNPAGEHFRKFSL